MWLTRKEEKRRRYSDSDESECHSTMLGPWPGHSKQDNLRSRGERAPPTSNKWAAALMAYEESLGDERYTNMTHNYHSFKACCLHLQCILQHKITLFYTDGITKPMACFQDDPRFGPHRVGTL